MGAAAGLQIDHIATADPKQPQTSGAPWRLHGHGPYQTRILVQHRFVDPFHRHRVIRRDQGVQAGLDIPIAPTSGNQTVAQMTQWAGFLPRQLTLPSALWPTHKGQFELDPRVEKAQAEMHAAVAARGIKPDNSMANSWDVALITVAGLNKIGPDGTAAQLRDYIANLQDFPGIDGIYDFKKYPERGLGSEAANVTRYDPATQSFVWLSGPGGRALAK